jgi:hypothetical protein
MIERGRFDSAIMLSGMAVQPSPRPCKKPDTRIGLSLIVSEKPISCHNLGGSIGISILGSQLAENTQTVHSRLVEQLGPDNPLKHAPYLAAPHSLTSPTGIAVLGAEVTRQATMVAYIDDFLLMSVVVLACLPFLLLVRVPARRAAAAG